MPLVLDLLADGQDYDKREGRLQDLNRKRLGLVSLLVFPELQILALFTAVDDPLFFRCSHKVMLKGVDLIDQLVCDLFLVV